VLKVLLGVSCDIIPQQTNISIDTERRAGLLAVAELLVAYTDLTLLSHSCWLDGTVMSVGRSSSSYALFILLYVNNNIRIYWIITKISSGNLLKICLVRFVDTPFYDVSEHCVIAIGLHTASHSCSICSNVWVTEQVHQLVRFRLGCNTAGGDRTWV